MTPQQHWRLARRHVGDEAVPLILERNRPPCRQTLRIDAPRANRVNEGKNNGLIVDYRGILKILRQALSMAKADLVRPEEDLLKELAAAITLVEGYLTERGLMTRRRHCEGFRHVRALQAKRNPGIASRSASDFALLHLPLTRGVPDLLHVCVKHTVVLAQFVKHRARAFVGEDILSTARDAFEHPCGDVGGVDFGAIRPAVMSVSM